MTAYVQIVFSPVTFLERDAYSVNHLFTLYSVLKLVYLYFRYYGFNYMVLVITVEVPGHYLHIYVYLLKENGLFM